MTPPPGMTLAQPPKKHHHDQAQRMLNQRAADHPDLFNADGTWKSAEAQKSFYEAGFVPNLEGAMQVVKEHERKLKEMAEKQAISDNDCPWSLNDPYPPFDTQVYQPEMVNWPELLPYKIYALDNSQMMVVNRPFDTHRQCYEAYPRVRSQMGYHIEMYISRYAPPGRQEYYTVVQPDAYKMPTDDQRHGQTIPPAEESELDKLLERPRLTRPAPRAWSALVAKTVAGQVNAASRHFATDLAIIDPKANPGVVMRKALKMELRRHIEQFGVQATVDKLQETLNNYGVEPMAKPTKEAWVKFLDEHGWTREEVLQVINAYNQEFDLGAVQSLTDLPDFSLASKLMHQQGKAKPAAIAEPSRDTAEAAALPPEKQQVDRMSDAAARENLPRTLTGISLLDIGREMSAWLPKDAYLAIKKGRPGAGKTSVDGHYVRRRFDDIFGVGMWRITPHELSGRVEYEYEDVDEYKKDQNGDFVFDANRERIVVGQRREHICTLQAHTLFYTVLMPDGSLKEMQSFTTSAVHRNVGRDNAYAGAMTTLVKHFYKLLGGGDLYEGKQFGQVQNELQKMQPRRLG